MKGFFNFLKKLFFIDLLATWLSSLSKRGNEQIKSIQSIRWFSWQVALSLSLLGWLVQFLIRSPMLRQFVTLYAWFFLIIGVDWFFLDDKDDKKKPQVPGLKLKINIGPWITGALICLALLSNRLFIRDIPTALVSWPIISVGVAWLPRILNPGLEPLLRVPKDAEVRQDLVILTLLGFLFSCWFQFHFLLQNLLARYPTVRGDDFSNSAFVVRVGPDLDFDDSPDSRGIDLLDTTEELIRQDLNGRSWIDVQRRLRDIPADIARFEAEAIETVYEDAPRAQESLFWRLNASFRDAIPGEVPPDDVLELQAVWSGPSSRPEGYILNKVCYIQRSPLAVAPNAPVGSGSAYVMNCNPVTSPFRRRDPQRNPDDIIE
ncbi:DUF5357 family protein [Thermocoleostomius sinensis]|uniref:DUF5357 family protein n=1 Tax=Thermocoleostomius sinensis A174 TaxID=2016057 RepID=A0A9E8ZFM3_9CYAN|nr:DUF5357 family protein [Thermocoleostomius sinensis]WAL62499.1 DUF5357 family protein [Thermocoleostomius sinensis A174]